MAGGQAYRPVAFRRSAIPGDWGLDLRILADTNVFIKFTHRQSLATAVERALEDDRTERFVSPVTVLEVFRLWKHGRLLDNPDTWIGDALTSWTVLPVTVAIARQSVLWNWEHRDPADRLLAATALTEKVELWRLAVLRFLFYRWSLCKTRILCLENLSRMLSRHSP